MGADRRRYERHSLSGKVVVERQTKAGNSASMSVYLRDISVGGFSGTYFGSMVPSAGDVLKLCDDEGPSTPVKLVWSHKTLECIHMLGFELLDDMMPRVAS
ncbi:MAG: hypothetical protein GF331_25205 [Chitinivibrionales bacterium]|nr:hypothetical protein [Chitinivibrionales bacterium]